KPQHEKTSISVSVEDFSGEWNFAAVGSMEGSISFYGINGSDTLTEEQRVKVAIIDSGVDDTGDIDVYLRKNFIPGENEISILYEDSSCHGTSVAGVIAALDNDEGITGINPNVLLYSARVLDSQNRAPVSRIVEAIDWAVAQKVDIINLSFGTTVDSPALRAAIQRAYNAGILLVAAAGNSGVVEYPAAYDEVIAVGAVDAHGDHSYGSAVGHALELVAPGEGIVSTGAFGGLCTAGGTSLAAPHVTGIASVLWQLDKSMPADFIRALLAFSANQYGDALEYGYGLVDLNFALSQYDSFKEVYQAGGALAEQIAEAVEDGTLEYNENAVTDFEDAAYVEGLWVNDPTKKWGTHEFLLQDKDDLTNYNDLTGINNETMTASGMTILKSAIAAPDKYFPIMQANPEWHGTTSRAIDGTGPGVEYYCNYVFSYLFITKIAVAVYQEQLPSSVDVPEGMSCNCTLGVDCVARMVANIKGKFTPDGRLKDEKGNGILEWSKLVSGDVTKQKKAIYIYGLAMHSVTDMFAHSTYTLDGKYISHTLGADNKNKCENRYDCARRICRYIIPHIKQFEEGSITDFYNVLSSTYDKSFKLKRLSEFVKIVDSAYYEAYKSVFDEANQN
ncbi:MAG: S8 family peptidase, partial [Lachnospiraceae bacterium]|nr:S8 family peptidase [Lachnospiraceae bacterium]